MNFKVIENDKEINCEVILTFSDDNNNINYIIYTDGTKDEDGELEIYASRYIQKDNDYIIEEIKYEYEWNLVDNMLESKFKGND
jgi:uncharacterized protein YrzB (UPF0473 family)